MESIEKLRTASKIGGRGWLMNYADEIEREVAERYTELPLDADGMPIHVGDSIEYPNGGCDVVRFITVNDNMPTFNERGWIPSKCRHVKPRTLEDVLSDYAFKMNEAYNSQYIGGEDRADELSTITDDCAAEIRELLGVEA